MTEPSVNGALLQIPNGVIVATVMVEPCQPAIGKSHQSVIVVPRQPIMEQSFQMQITNKNG